MAFGVETVAVLTISVFIIATNVIILLVVVKTDTMSLLNRHFFVSLTVADLVAGSLIAPLSVWPTILDRWPYGDRLCQIEACLTAALGVASVHSLAWLSVDQYVAIRKPERHPTIMTPTRSACWVAVVWATAVGFSTSPLFGDSSTARYYSEAYICAIDWTSQTAYFMTAAVLVLVPPIVVLMVTSAYVLRTRFEREKPSPGNVVTVVVPQPKSSSMVPSSAFVLVPSMSAPEEPDSTSRPELYTVTIVVVGVHIVAWLPWCILQLYCHFAAAASAASFSGAFSATSFDRISAGPTYMSLARTRFGGQSIISLPAEASDSGNIGAGPVPMVGPASLHFWFAWLSIGNSFLKFFVYLLCFHDFRTGLKVLYYTYISCR